MPVVIDQVSVESAPSADAEGSATPAPPESSSRPKSHKRELLHDLRKLHEREERARAD